MNVTETRTYRDPHAVAVATLIELANDSDPRVRLDASTALLELSGDARQAWAMACAVREMRGDA